MSQRRQARTSEKPVKLQIITICDITICGASEREKRVQIS